MQVLTPKDKIPDFVYCIESNSNRQFGVGIYGVIIYLRKNAIYKVNHNLGDAEGNVDLSIYRPVFNTLAYGYLSGRFRALYKNEERLCNS